MRECSVKEHSTRCSHKPFVEIHAVPSWPWEVAPCSRRQIVRYLCARFTVVQIVAGDIHDTFTQTSTPFAILQGLRDQNTQKCEDSESVIRFANHYSFIKLLNKVCDLTCICASDSGKIAHFVKQLFETVVVCKANYKFRMLAFF